MRLDSGAAIPSEHRVDTYPPDARLIRSVFYTIPLGRTVLVAGAALVAFAAAFAVGALTTGLWGWLPGWVAAHWPWLLGALALAMAVGLLRRMVRAGDGGRMMPLIVNVLLVVLVGLTAFAAAAALIWWGVGQPELPDERRLDLPATVDLIKLGLTVAAGLGGVMALVVAYRRQRVTERENARADEETARAQVRDERESTKFLTERYAAASVLLGHEEAAVRLAGVYAIAALADDWPGQRQACIDVLCAYLRMPYEPAREQPGFRLGEREVRLSITRVIRDRLRIDARVSWLGHTLDFTGAVFDGGDFSQILVGDRIDMSGARFVAGTVDFRDATFAGGVVDLTGAEFSGGRLDLRRAGFRDTSLTGVSVLDLRGARLSDGVIDMRGAAFRGGGVDLRGIVFTGGRVDLDAPAVWDHPPVLDEPGGVPPAGLRLPAAGER
jgi:hypothetical protein